MSALAVGARVGPALHVDLDAVAANTRLFAARTPGALMAVVKADGFGHGAAAVARTALAHGASWLGVTSLGEACALRREGLTAPILSWLNPVEADFAGAIAGRIDVAVPSRAHLDALTGAGIGFPPRRSSTPPLRSPAEQHRGDPESTARVHLHLDTGMARDGAAPAEWAALCRAARRAEAAGWVRVVGVMGHLGCADVPADPANAEGRRVFAWGLDVARGCGLRPPLRHLAATAATLTDPASVHTMSRVGAGLVGIDPSHTTRLHPALTLAAPVVAIRRVAAGTAVGYGHTWLADRPTTLALLPLGYADGLPRASAGHAAVLLRERRCPLVGAVSMDQVVVDVGEGGVTVGETATVFGPGDDGEPTVADWATWSGTIEHEIVTRIGSRVAR